MELLSKNNASLLALKKIAEKSENDILLQELKNKTTNKIIKK